MKPSDIYNLLTEIRDVLGAQSVALCIDDLPEMQLYLDNGVEDYSIVIHEDAIADMDIETFVRECFEQYIMLSQNTNYDTLH